MYKLEGSGDRFISRAATVNAANTSMDGMVLNSSVVLTLGAIDPW